MEAPEPSEHGILDALSPGLGLSNVAEDRTSRSSTNDLEDLLNLAEQLRENCDRTSTRLGLTRAVQLVAMMFAIGGLWIPQTTPAESTDWPPPYYVLIGGGTLVMLATWLQFGVAHRFVRRLRRDRRALGRIVDILHETEDFVANESRWSAIQKGIFQIRRSRIDAEMDLQRRRREKPVVFQGVIRAIADFFYP